MTNAILGLLQMSVDEQLASWVPASFLSGLLLTALGIIWRSFAKRLDDIDIAIKSLSGYATRAQLDDAHEQIILVRERVAVAEANISHLTSRGAT